VKRETSEIGQDRPGFNIICPITESAECEGLEESFKEAQIQTRLAVLSFVMHMQTCLSWELWWLV